MKRAFLRKVKPVSCSSLETAGQPEQIPAGVNRRARTSAAMFGLALSMGATSLVLPHHEDGASAAEPKGTEAIVPSVSQVAALPTDETPASVEAATSAITVVEHVVREGQTLLQIARSYRVRVEDITAANGLESDAQLKSGQTLKIPVGVPVAKVTAPELVASADLSQIPAVTSPVVTPSTEAEAPSVRADRDSALSRLREQQSKLRDSLAELRSEESSGSVVATRKTEASAPTEVATAEVTTAEVNENAKANATQALPQINEKPSTITYRVQPGDTLASIARTHGVSQRDLMATNNLPDPDWIRVSQSLNIPSSAPVVANAPSTLPSPVAEATPSPVVLPATPSVPAPTQQVAIAPAQLQEYRVNPGDTAAQIARSHNIPLSILVNANRLSNPNVIFVGQVLRVPAGTAQASVEIASAQPQSLPAIAPRPSAPETTRSVALNPVQPASEFSAENRSDDLPAAAPESGRYVENLLAEVRALREKHQGQPVSQSVANSQQPTVVAANDAVSTNAVGLSRPTRPQFSTGGSRPTVPQASSAQAQPDLVATASINPENYAPLRQPLTGRMVSPDVPPLPGAEAFLPEGARSSGYIWPTKGLLTSGYGYRWGRMHQGIDIAADVGTPIYAAGDGVIEYSDWNSGGYGNLVDIRHADGSLTRYAHLNRSFVRAGQRVRQGEQIAEMGSTGYSTGPHLHFEVHPSGQGAVNPVAFLPQQ